MSETTEQAQTNYTAEAPIPHWTFYPPTTPLDSAKFTGKVFRRYKIIETQTAKETQAQVAQHLREGWALCGGLGVVSRLATAEEQRDGWATVTVYTQAITRWNDEGLTVDSFVCR